MGPNSAANPALPCIERASLAREAAVGNADTYVDALDAIVAPKTSPHRTPGRAARPAVVAATALEARRSS